MTILPFPEYAPDVATLQQGVSDMINNVLPQKNGYGPIPSPAVYSSALAGAARGFFRARLDSGDTLIFAATATKLYTLNNSDFTWTDVSKGGGSYTGIPNADQWQFVQFNKFVIAVQINTVPQVIDLTAPTAFADLGGSPPQARYIAVVNRFIVLSGIIASAFTGAAYAIQWSGLNATTTWTSGVNQSDFQVFPDGGLVRTIGGGESGMIMQDSAIRRMIYAPGSSYVFQIERVSQDKGIYAPLSLVRAGDRLFYCGNEGFQVVTPGAYPQPIGKERVDKTFFADVDAGNLQLMLGAVEPRATRVYWAYKSVNGNTSLFDKVLIYDYALDRWALATGISGEYLCNLARPGFTLDSVAFNAIVPNIDSTTLSSFDDISTSTIEFIAAFDSLHKLNFITGPPLEATLDTTEQEADGWSRLRIQGMRPVTDASSCFGNVYHRELTTAAFSSSAEQGMTAIGVIPANVSARLAKGRLRIPAGATWTYATGVEPRAKQEGMR